MELNNGGERKLGTRASFLCKVPLGEEEVHIYCLINLTVAAISGQSEVAQSGSILYSGLA
jgi:hypothetical protein